MTYLENALADGHAKIIGEGKSERIHYVAADHSERWAEFWAELIYKYEYKPERIGIEVKVERRTPDDRADVVIYTDDEGKNRCCVFHSKRDDVSACIPQLC